jgi:hypothetical protein
MWVAILSLVELTSPPLDRRCPTGRQREGLQSGQTKQQPAPEAKMSPSRLTRDDSDQVAHA